MTQQTTWSAEERYAAMIAYFSKAMPNPKSELNFTNQYELIIAVILSAQCTDKRVNMVTPAIFERWPDFQSLARATAEEVLEYIRSVSYPNSKCEYLVGMARMVCEEFGGSLPRTREELLRLPGVGRKTANVILIEEMGVEAMPVDTHVFRVAERLGLTHGSKTPERTERELVRQIPRHLLPKAHHWLVLFGRYTCTAQSPKCAECPFTAMCLRLHPGSYDDGQMTLGI